MAATKRPKLKEHMQYCMSQPEEMSKLVKVKTQISEVKGIMMIEKLDLRTLDDDDGCFKFNWPYWRCYFPDTQAIIYVVDSSDTDRLAIAKDEFHAILEEEELKGAVVLIFANKQVPLMMHL